MASPDSVLEKLKSIRTRTDLVLRPTKILRKTILDLGGQRVPLHIRYYQVQGILHLVTMPRFVLGDDTGIGKCVTGDTLIQTNRGLVPIRHIAPEAKDPDTFTPVEDWKVWTGFEWASVKQFYYSGKHPTVKVTTRCGFQVEGTFVHPLMTRTTGGETFVKLEHIHEGDYLCVDRTVGAFPTEEPLLMLPDLAEIAPHAKRYPVPDRMNPRLARLLAYIVSEGYTRQHYFSQSKEINPQIHNEIRDLLLEQLGWEGDLASEKDIQVGSVYLRKYLTHLGIAPVLSAAKTIPDPILRSTRESVVAFLQGMFESAGSVVAGGVELSSASEKLSLQLQILLLRFGIVAHRSPKLVSGHDHIYWSLVISGADVDLFSDTIGFVSCRKRNSLANEIRERNPNLDVIPHVSVQVAALYSQLKERMAAVGGIQTLEVSFGDTLCQTKQRNLSHQKLAELLTVSARAGLGETPEYKYLVALRDRRYFYDPVEVIEISSNEVMDLEIDPPRHSFVGNGLVNHNTLESIGALAYLWEKNPDQKVLVLTTKSAVKQWLGEFKKFTKGVTVVICKGTPDKRHKILAAFQKLKGPCVLLMGYRTAVSDFSHIQTWKDHILIADEATAFKNHKTQVHQVVRHLADQAARVWGLTATIIKNHLVEGYGIYKVIQPDLFGSHSGFVANFCVTRLQPIKRGRKIPVIIGYRKGQIAAFRNLIDPYFLGRAKFEVASELPVLTTQKVMVTMSPEQEEAYAEALSGVLQVGTTLGTIEEKEITKLTAVTYCQEIANHLGLVDRIGGSDKLDTLVDLVTTGDFAGEKVIVFTRFRKMVDIAIPVLTKEGIHCVRITGTETEDQREEAKQKFLNLKSNVNVIFITAAGSESINLQVAAALIFYDTPWSAGDYLQIIGRMIRIGSVHDRVHALHLVAEHTIDQRVMEVLGRKLRLIEAVIGKRVKGEGEDFTVEAENDLSAIFKGLQEDARQMLRA